MRSRCGSRIEFTPKDWNSFGQKDLRADHYIYDSDKVYFMPADDGSDAAAAAAVVPPAAEDAATTDNDDGSTMLLLHPALRHGEALSTSVEGYREDVEIIEATARVVMNLFDTRRTPSGEPLLCKDLKSVFGEEVAEKTLDELVDASWMVLRPVLYKLGLHPVDEVARDDEDVADQLHRATVRAQAALLGALCNISGQYAGRDGERIEFEAEATVPMLLTLAIDNPEHSQVQASALGLLFNIAFKSHEPDQDKAALRPSTRDPSPSAPTLVPASQPPHPELIRTPQTRDALSFPLHMLSAPPCSRTTDERRCAHGFERLRAGGGGPVKRRLQRSRPLL